MDKDITPFDIMNDTVLFNFFQDWGAQILFAIAVWYIIEKLKEIDRKGIKRDNIARLTEMKVDSIAHSLEKLPPPFGDDFHAVYKKHLDERMGEDKYVDTRGIK